MFHLGAKRLFDLVKSGTVCQIGCRLIHLMFTGIRNTGVPDTCFLDQHRFYFTAATRKSAFDRPLIAFFSTPCCTLHRHGFEFRALFIGQLGIDC